MTKSVKPRRYDASRRRLGAEQTRLRILEAARDLFLSQGFDATSVRDVAARAGTSVDTIYASVGRKPALLLAVHDMELAAAATPLPATERDYVKDVRAAGSAAEKLRRYAAAMAHRLPRTVPLMEALRAASLRDESCRVAYDSLSQRRLANMGVFATELRATGDLREDLTDDDVARLLWSMNSPDYFRLLADSGATPAQYADLVYDTWTRTLLRTPAGPTTDQAPERRRT